MELFRIFGTIDIDDGDANRVLKDVDKSAQKLGDQLNKTTGSSDKTSGGFKGMAKSLGGFAGKVGVFKVVEAGLGMITRSVGSAVNRFDTLQNSQKVFENMGYNANTTKEMMDKLIVSVTGLPTPMEDAVQGVQRIVSATGDLAGSEAIYSALNNGVLAFGGSNEQVNASIEMMSRGLQKGNLDGQEFNSLMKSMGPAINAVGETMGYTSKELQKGLSDGSIDINEFTDALIDMNVNGGAGMASLDKMARDMTGGISTSIANVQNAINRGMASIIEATNEVLESNGFPNIAELVAMFGRTMEKWMKASAVVIGSFVQAVLSMVAWVTDNFPEVGSTISTVMNIVKDVISLVIGIITAIWDSWGENILAVVKLVFGNILNIITTMMNMVQAVINIVTSLIKGDWEGVWQGVKDYFIAMWDGIKGYFEGLVSMVGVASDIFTKVKDAIMKPIDKAVELVGNAVQKIKDFFSTMKLNFPKLNMPKLPTFSLTGKFSILPPSVPRVSVSWNKDGGIFSKPTIFDTANAGLQGVGEAGSEAIIPLNKQVLGGIGDGIAKTMGNNGSGGDIIQNITINTPQHLSPAEVARENKKMLQRLALEM